LLRPERQPGGKDSPNVSASQERNGGITRSYNRQEQFDIALVPPGVVESETSGEPSPILADTVSETILTAELLKASLWEASDFIQNIMKVHPQSTSWRTNETYFKSEAECRYKSGTTSFGLAWFQQGMAVRNYFSKIEINSKTLGKT
jgi:hypothetical protein